MPLRLVFLSIPNSQLPTPKAIRPRGQGRRRCNKLCRRPFTQLRRAARFGSWRLGVGGCLALLLAANAAVSQPSSTRSVTWNDLGALRNRLQREGVTAATFDDNLQRLRQDNLRRVREGDLDHLVFYLLQSTRFTPLPAIEPAVSARALVASLDPPLRDRFLNKSELDVARVPPAVRSRIAAFEHALAKPGDDARLRYFKDLAGDAFPRAGDLNAALGAEYLRAMRFVYQKEFVAQRTERPADAVADLYRTRGLSTDTAVEAGYLVHLGLAVAKGLQPDRRIRRVLIVGPGMDLAPRTGFRDAPPESYQPWAVIDALVSTGFASLDDLEVTAADINPRVVAHLRRSRTAPPALALTSEIAETDGITFSRDYREYFAGLGTHLSAPASAPAVGEAAGHLRKSVRVGDAAARALRAEPLDIVTERFTGPPFDLVIATNILPYFDDQQLALAASNIAAMVAPGGVFLHNEARPVLGELTAALGLPFVQSRHAVIATVKGAPAPLFDSVFLHVRNR
jgi:hypothetical protein